MTDNAPRRDWWRVVVSVVLITLGAIAAPLSVVGSWVNTSLTSTDTFVATYGPLSQNPEVQSFVSGQIVDAIGEHVDATTMTNDVIDGIIDLGTGPVATRALEALKGPAAAGIRSLVTSTVESFVASDAFSAVWSESLRISHAELISVLSGSGQGALTVEGSDVGIQLGPIVERVKQALIDQGLGFASLIPSVDRMIVLAHSDVMPTLQLAYRLATVGGFWLPFLCLGLLVAGVLVARRRLVGLLGASLAVAGVMAVTLAAFAIGDAVFLQAVSPGIPGGVASLLFASVATTMQQTAVAVLVLALIVALTAWITGPLATPTRLRTWIGAPAADPAAATATKPAPKRRG